MTKTSKRLLVAEDNATQAAVLRAHLEQAGFEVGVAGNGAETLALMEGEPFDLVVSDVVMPDVDGYELCRQVKDRYPSVPVVLLTSMTDPLDVVNSLSAGADNFLRKPYAPNELVHRIGNMLRNKQLRESGRAQMGLELFFLGRRFMINADREQILDLLVSTFEDLVGVNHRLRASDEELAHAHDELAARLTETELERDRLRAVLAAMPGGVAVFDTACRVLNANQQLADLVGVALPTLQGSVVWDVIQFVDHRGHPIPQEERALSETMRHGYGAVRGTAFDLFLDGPQGSRLPVLARSEPIRDGAGCVVGAVGTLQDLRTLMDHDPVTGLPGHGILVDRLNAAVQSLSDRGTKTGLVVITVDRWARIWESLSGKENEVVAVVANSLREAISSEEVQQRSPTGSPAYLGNGELVVILPDIDGEAEALLIGHLLTGRMSGTVDVDGTAITWTVSAAVGICDDAAVAEIVASVVASAQRASAEGGSRVVASDETLNAHVVNRLRLESELRTAIATDQLVIHYHPLVNIRDGRPVAVEALVRWQHPERGLLGAADVVPLAIESGLICSLGWYVLEAACRQGARWHDELHDGARPSLSVNLAAEQLADADAADRIAAILSDTGFDPTALVLEITEGSVMADADSARDRLAAIKALGVRMAIDDFGTGYSSLLQLRRLPIDVLKIDRTFVAGMLEEPADAAIVTSVVRLGHSLGLEVIAEGIENADQLVQLRLLGCDLGQGYHWAKPMPAAQMSRWWSEQLTLPRSDDPSRSSSVSAAHAPAPERTGGRSSTVLCVEDDVSTTELIGHIFDSHPDVALVVAHDGLRGLRLAQEEPPDLVLLDLNIDGISGEEILETMRSQPDTAAIPVVILTADADPMATSRLLTTGAAAVVEKPFNPERLREIVDAVLASAQPSTEPARDTNEISRDPLDPAMIAALKDLDGHSNSGKGVDRLVWTAINDAHGRLRTIEAAASRHDADEMIRHAHALRGALANLGAHLVAERCRDIETIARTGDMGAAPAALTRVSAALAEATDALHRHFPSDDEYRFKGEAHRRGEFDVDRLAGNGPADLDRWLDGHS